MAVVAILSIRHSTSQMQHGTADGGFLMTYVHELFPICATLFATKAKE